MPKVFTRDAGLAFYVNQLEQFDRRINAPLIDFTWSRDIKLRSDVSFANESASYTTDIFGHAAANQQDGVPFIGDKATVINAVNVGANKVVQPLRIAALESTYTFAELERAQLLGQSLDQRQLNVIQAEYQRSIDLSVYVGLQSQATTGLINNAAVPVAGATQAWIGATPDQIRTDLNTLITSTWKTAAYAVAPNAVLLPPDVFGYLATTPTSSAGTISILEYVSTFNAATTANGQKLRISPLKWAAANSAQGITANRAIAYNDDERFVRFPLVPIERRQVYFSGITYHAPYVWSLGQTEIIYPETIGYLTGV